MDPGRQHRVNAGKEKQWIHDAERDRDNLRASGLRLIRMGETIEGNFDLEESHNAASWINKRQRILRREERLGKSR